MLVAKLTNGESQVMMALKSGKAIRFEEAKTRPMGRSASGVRGIRLQHDKDEVIGMVSVNDMESNILVVSSNGYGKRAKLEDYRVTNRGGKGIIGIVNSARNGNVSSSFLVYSGDQILISTNKGRVIRVAVKEIRVAGRNTQGVRIIKLSGDEKVVSAIKIDDNLL